MLSCPHCRFSFRPRATYLTLDYCPRCLAHRRVAEPLLAMPDPPRPVSTFASPETRRPTAA